MLLTVLISGSAYASGTGYAVGTNSTANGVGSYATSENGVATGHNAVATGGGMSREQFAERRKVADEIVRQLGEKQTEINKIDAQISSVQSHIDNIEASITDIDQRQAKIVPLLKEYATLQNQRDEAQKRLAEQQNQLQQANDAYNRLPQDIISDNTVNYDGIFKKLDWSKLDNESGKGRDELAADIKVIIEEAFPEFKGNFTAPQYRQLIDGYVASNATAEPTAKYLSSFINDNIYGTRADSYTFNADLFRTIFSTEDDLKTPNKLPGFGLSNFNDLSSFRSYAVNREAIEGYRSRLYFYLSAKKENSNARLLLNTYGTYSYYYGNMIKMPPLKGNKTIDLQSISDDGDSYRRSVLNNGSQGYVDNFKKINKMLKDIVEHIDYTKNDSWWFDLTDYKSSLDRIIKFNDTVEEWLELDKKLQLELSKPLDEQDKTEIDKISQEVIKKKDFIDREKDKPESNFNTYTPTYKNDVIEKEFSQVKPIVEELYNQTRERIHTYNQNNEVVKATSEKVKQLYDALLNAKDSIDSTERDIRYIIDDISRLGLTPDDEALAERKQQQEQLLNQRKAELEKQNQDLAAKQAELAQLNRQLANSPIKNIGKNSLAEGESAFASGENAIAYGANTLATAENAIALGSNAIATGKNAVALGAGSLAVSENEVSVGVGKNNLGKTEFTRKITNVTAGEADTDVVNISQLKYVIGAVAKVANQVQAVDAKIDTEVGKVNTQLKEVIGAVVEVDNKVSSRINGIDQKIDKEILKVANVLGATLAADGSVEVKYDYYEQGEKKTTNNVKTALNAAAQNTKYVSVNSTGNSAKAEGAESVAIGANSVAKGSNSVAVGTGSVAMSDNEFSVGNANAARRITNVAEGVSETDAVNMGQFTRGMNALGGQVNQLENKIARTEKRMSSGIAGAYAAASLINAPGAGDSMLSVGTGTFNGATAVALGYSKVSNNGKVSLKLIGSASNKGDVGGGASIGFKF
ncbi:YadA-like family protein [Mannheimia pernigra]|uniref:YadA-like family protein n=1 Tax=Mannheimia pernigra TaxID=111844 RepID=UPI00159F409C|nr:YadA-like family protein [Mannheimia pernigra]QLB45151.1 YadA-like family protein [Mannheimia pernigra]